MANLAASEETKIRTRAIRLVAMERSALSATIAAGEAMERALQSVRNVERASSVRLLPLWPFSECRPLAQALILLVFPVVAFSAWQAWSVNSHPTTRIARRRVETSHMFSAADAGLSIQAPKQSVYMRHRSSGSIGSASGAGGFSSRFSSHASPALSAISPTFTGSDGGMTPKSPRFEL